MEKDKKYNVILGLMIFFFVLVVGISLAWGLSSINKSSKGIEIEKQNSNIVTENINTENQESTNNIISDDKESQKEEKNKTNYGLYNDGSICEMAITPGGLVVYGAQDREIGWVETKNDTKFTAKFDYYNMDINIVDLDTINYAEPYEESSRIITLNKVNNVGVIISKRTNEKVLPGVYVREDDSGEEIILFDSGAFYCNSFEVDGGMYQIENNVIKLNADNKEAYNDANELVIKDNETLIWKYTDGSYGPTLKLVR